MKQQTAQLAGTFPKLRKQYEAADSGGWDFAICRAIGHNPANIRAEDCKPLSAIKGADGQAKDNRYSSRTAALRASKTIAQKADDSAHERGSWGGWQIKAVMPGETEKETSGARKGRAVLRECIQLVIPIPRKGGDSAEEEADKPAKAANSPAQKGKQASAANPARKGMTAAEKEEAKRLAAQSPAEIKAAQEAQAKEAAIAHAASEQAQAGK